MDFDLGLTLGGTVKGDPVVDIIRCAWENGVNFIDTAEGRYNFYNALTYSKPFQTQDMPLVNQSVKCEPNYTRSSTMSLIALP